MNESKISPEVKKGLDKLYNLRGSDSAILQEIDTYDEEARHALEVAKGEEVDFKTKISAKEEEKDLYEKQGNKWASFLDIVNPEEVKDVLIAMDSKFNLEREKNTFETKLPELISKIEREISDAKDNLKRVQKDIKAYEKTIKEMSLRREEALENQDLLNMYIDRALNGDLTITREEVTSLLDRFVFIGEEGVYNG